MASPTEESSLSGLYVALYALRASTAGLSILIFASYYLLTKLFKAFKGLQRRAYTAIGTEAESTLPTNPYASKPPQASRSPIVPVVVQLREKRSNLIIALFALVAVTYLVGDGAVLVARAILSNVWEPELKVYRLETFYLSTGFVFGLTAILLAHDREEGKQKRAWKSSFPVSMVSLVFAAETALLGVMGATIRKRHQEHDHKLTAYDIAHFVVLGLRVLLLLQLALAFSPPFLQNRFLKAKNADGYGTFDNASGTVTPEEQAKKPTDPSMPTPPPPVSFTTLIKKVKVLAPYLWPAKSKTLQFVAVLCFIILALGRVVNVGVPLFLGYTVGALSDGVPPWTYLFGYIALRFMQGSGGILNVLQSNLWIPVSQYSDREVTLMTFNHLLNLSMQYHNRRKTGEVLRALDRGSAINTFFQMLLFSIFPIFADIGAAVVIFFFQFGGLLSVVVFAVLVIYVAVSVILTRRRVALRRAMNESDKFCRGIHTDALISVETVKYFTAEEWEIQRYREAMQDYQKKELRVMMSLSVLNLSQNLVISVGMLVGTLIIAWQVVNGQARVAQFVTFVAYLQQLYGPLNSLGTLYRVINQNLIDTEQLMNLLGEQAEVKDRENATELLSSKGEIEFKDVSFSYNNGESFALRNVSFKIPAGSSAAFVGPSGSGKSTIMRLMFRFYDVTSGQILIDGVDIRDLTQKSLRKQIGVIPQESVLFNESIGYNLAYSKPGCTREDIEEAARLAQMHDRILTFPGQYETVVGERGVRLSGGEKQRVSIARAILKDPPILLLDEATSALDTTTERLIQEALNGLQKGRTSMSIAHRLSTIVNSNIIFVLEEGKICEEGDFKDLNKKDGMFKQLWQKQIQAEAETVEEAEAMVKDDKPAQEAGPSHSH